MTTTTTTNQITNCASCFNQINQDDAFCTSCGYPLKGSEEEQKNFIMEKNTKEIYLEEENRQIKKSGYALYYIAAATFLSGLILYGTSKNPEIKSTLLLVNTVLAVIYAALGFWSKWKPLAAIISGSALYALVFILNAVTSPLTIFSGIILKIFIVVNFVRGIQSAIRADKLRKDLNIG
ncbi:MAG: zinc ribbon domain-containing protein [Mucilaginibacter sp.]|nr:zinc ribbon domain-containing protein [Mucilaginibacter sp.]